MADWMPYLHELLGNDAAARSQAEDLLTLRDALRFPARAVAARIRLVDWVDDLDPAKQVFLLPWLMDLLSDQAPAVRDRMLDWVLEFLGEGQRPLVDALRRLSGPGGGTAELRQVVQGVDRACAAEPGLDAAAPFSAIVALRTQVFAVCVLGAVTRCIRKKSAHETLAAEMERLLAENPRLLAQLRDWVTAAPVFLRYLLLTWLGESGVSLKPGEPARRLLQERYREERDPLATGAAVEAYAAQGPGDDLSATVQFLWDEYISFATRPLRWDTAHYDTSAAVRTTSLSILRALGSVAVANYPAREPLEAVMKVCRAAPDLRLDLFTARLTDAQKARVVEAAVLLHGSHRVRVHVRTARQRGAWVANPGFGAPIPLDPREAGDDMAGQDYWAEPVRSDDGGGWTFVRRDRVAGSSPAEGLLAMVTCAFSHTLPGRRKVTPQQVLAEVDLRGPWMLELSGILAELVSAARQHEEGLSSEPARTLLSYLADLAAGASWVELSEVRVPETKLKLKRLKDKLTSLLINRFNDQDSFDQLFGGADSDPLRPYILASLARSAFRSLPGTPESRWIYHNLLLLRDLALDPSVRLSTRAQVATLLRLLPGEDARALAQDVTFSAAEALAEFPPAVCLVPGKELQAKEPLIEASMREGVVSKKAIPVAAELLARELEAGRAGSPLAERAAAVGVRTFADGEELPDGSKELRWIEPFSRRRLLQAYAQSGERCEGSVQRLLERLLRSANTTELDYFLTLLAPRGGPGARPGLVRLLVEILLETSSAGTGPSRVRLDSKQVEDRLLRRPAVLRALTSEAAAHAHVFLEEYRTVRGMGAPAEGSRAAALTARVLPGAPADDVDLLVTEAGTGYAEDDFAARAVGVLPAFVHRDPGGAELRFLARFHPAPPGAVDPLALPFDAARRKALLTERIRRDGRAVALGRVADAHPGWCVELGTGRPLPLRGAPDGAPPRPGDALLVELAPAVRETLRDVQLAWVREGAPAGECLDLRDHPDGGAALLAAWRARGGRRLLLAATVERPLPGRSDTTACLVDAGFQHLWRGKPAPSLPAVFVPVDEAPAAGSEIVVEVTSLDIQMAPEVGGPPQVRPYRAAAAVEGSTGMGTVHRVQGGAGERPHWVGRLGAVELPVPRDRLTADVWTLLALEACGPGGGADEGAEGVEPPRALRRLAEEGCPLVVVDGGRALSVLDAPPRWTIDDLALAVAAGTVERVTVLRRQGAELVLELHRPEGVADEGPASEPLLGMLARVAVGEICGEAGAPLAAAELPPGVQLVLEVRTGERQDDGSYHTPVEEGVGWAEAYLARVGENDTAQLRLRTVFRRGSTISVLCTGTAEVPRVEYAGWWPWSVAAPALRIDGRAASYFRRAAEKGGLGDGAAAEEGGEAEESVGGGGLVTAMVVEDWDPFGDRYAVTIGQPDGARIAWAGDDAGVLRLLRLNRGDVVEGDRRFGNGERGVRCYVGNLPVDIDPMLAHLLPGPLSAAELNRLAREGPSGLAPVLVTGIDPVKPRELEFPRDAAQIPFLAQGERITGVVVQTPFAEQEEGKTGVCWVQGDPDAAPDACRVSQPWFFSAPRFVRNGDLMFAEMRDRRTLLVHQRRPFVGTVLHEPVPLDRSALTGGPLRAVYLERNATDVFFAVAPATLLRVHVRSLLEPERLGQAWSLDRVELETGSGGAGRAWVRVNGVEPGPLRRAAQGRRFALTATRTFDPFSRTRLWELRAEEGRPLLPPFWLWLADWRAPRPRGASAGARTTPGDSLPCALRTYRCRLTERQARTPDGLREALEIRIEPELVPYSDRTSRDSQRQKRTLDELFAEDDRPEATGRVEVAKDARRIYLDDILHDGPLPVPLEEQTWLPATGELLAAQQARECILFRERGETFASVRRVTPRSLEAWLDARLWRAPGRYLVDQQRLLYYGRLDPRERAECALDDAAEAETAAPTEEAVLFEAGPGDAFVAEPSQLRFQGVPFGRDALRRGDVVREFEVRREADGGCRLEVRIVELDIRHAIERFDRRDGVFFGRLRRKAQDAVSLVELSGLDERGSSVMERRARWTVDVVLEEGDLPGLQAVADDEDVVYLKFDHADDAARVLYFRPLREREVFALNHLVYVRATGIRPGKPASLTVAPLARRYPGEYSITENRYSERHGRLADFRAADVGRIYLAHVLGREVGMELSLTTVPPRRFWHLMGRRRWQAIIKSVPRRGHDVFELEVGLGENVELPPGRIMGWASQWRDTQFRRGDVLLLETLRDPQMVRIREVVPSQLAYVDNGQDEVVLTELWGEKETRERRAGSGRPLNCRLAGLPQLVGECFVEPENLLSKRPVAQQIDGLAPDRRYPILRDRLPATAVVGRLEVEEAPAIVTGSGERHRLDWAQVTVRTGTARELAAALRDEVRWRNWAAAEPEGIDTCPVVARRLGSGEVSLSLGRLPFPVDHLAEQFGPPAAGGSVQPLSFAVAVADDERIVVEVAPGRFVELPVVLLDPLRDGTIREEVRPDWCPLARGDVVTVIPSQRRDDEGTGVLPHFRIVSVRPGHERPFRTPFVTLLNHNQDGAFLGVAGPAAIPLLDHPVDLCAVEPPEERFRVLRDLFELHGARLVLEAESVPEERPGEYSARVGILVPERGRGERHPRHRVRPERPPISPGSRCRVRVLGLAWEGSRLVDFDYVVEGPGCDPRPRVVRAEYGRIRAHGGPPLRGDAVMVVRGDDRALRVLGAPRHEVVWGEDYRDPLLADARRRERLLDRLLRRRGVLWATVSDLGENRLFLSRSLQLERVIPSPGRSVLARIVEVVDEQWLRVDLFGVPHLLATREYCLGAPPARALRESLDAGEEEWVEVTSDAAGRLSALAVYEPPPGGDFRATVERTTSDGLLADHRGSRIFVPTRELAWARLPSAAVVAALFATGSVLRVRGWGGNAQLGFSHVRTRDVLSEVASLSRRIGDPIYVTREQVLEEEGIALVRSRSRLLMELRLQSGEAMPEGACVRVQEVDRLRRRVVLSLHDAPRNTWALVAEPPRFAVDAICERLVDEKVAALESELVSGGPAEVWAWARAQTMLEPGPRALRLTLETLARIEGEAWTSFPEDVPPGAGLAGLLAQVAALLGGGTPAGVSPEAHFGAGYWLLLRRGPAEALPHLRAALAQNPRPYFDLPFTLARAEHAAGDPLGRRRLRSTLLRLWASAGATLPVPVPEPGAVDPLTPEGFAWNDLVAAGNIDEIRRALLARVRNQPGTPESDAARIWLRMLKGEFGPALDRLAESFFRGLDDERSAGFAVAPHLYTLAARLRFARGEVREGWASLEAARGVPHPKIPPAVHFWAAWLADASRSGDADPLLRALADLADRLAWSAAFDAELDAAWSVFRGSRQRWLLDAQTCRVVPAFPRGAEALHGWARENGAESSLSYVAEVLGVDLPQGRATDARPV